MGTLVLGSGRAREEQKARALLLPSIPRQLSRKHLGPLSVPPFTPPSEPPQVTDALSVATLVARSRIDGQGVVMAKHNAFPILRHEQFRRECSIPRPERKRILHGEIRVEFERYSIGRAVESRRPYGVVVEPVVGGPR